MSTGKTTSAPRRPEKMKSAKINTILQSIFANKYSKDFLKFCSFIEKTFFGVDTSSQKWQKAVI